MATTGLNGPYSLTREGIGKNVVYVSPGAYALGAADQNGLLTVWRVGRADKDIADRLADHAGSYSHFKFGYYGSPKAAFEKECHLYHDFSLPNNKIHPDRPNGSNWACPRCYIFD